MSSRNVSKRSKKDLRGLWETLAPSSTVVRTSPTTTIIKEPGVPEVRVSNSDIAKFGTRTERNTDLWQYAQRRPLPYDNTTEEMIAQHTKDLQKKYRGEIKIDIDQLSLTLLLGSYPQTATFQKPCPPDSPKASSWEKSLWSILRFIKHLQCLVSCCVISHLVNCLAFNV